MRGVRRAGVAGVLVLLCAVGASPAFAQSQRVTNCVVTEFETSVSGPFTYSTYCASRIGPCPLPNSRVTLQCDGGPVTVLVQLQALDSVLGAQLYQSLTGGRRIKELGFRWLTVSWAPCAEAGSPSLEQECLEAQRVWKLTLGTPASVALWSYARF